MCAASTSTATADSTRRTEGVEVAVDPGHEVGETEAESSVGVDEWRSIIDVVRHCQLERLDLCGPSCMHQTFTHTTTQGAE
jgi:hypothetical protein